MKRRDLLARATLPAVAGAVLAGCLDGTATDDGSDGDDGGDAAPDGAESLELPIEIRTVDAPGSEAGTTTVPRPDRALLINFTRTRCPTSEGFLGPLGEANAALEAEYDVGLDGGTGESGDRNEGENGDENGEEAAPVGVLSVTNGTRGPQPSADELAAWWREHDGDWPIGIDENGRLNDYYGVRGFPTTVAIDGDGAVHWRADEPTNARNVVAGVEDALEAERGRDP